MGNRIVIAGAGGFGRGVYSWIRQSPQHMKTNGIDDVVFIDDIACSPDTRAPVISTIADYVPLPEDLVVPAIGSPSARRQVVNGLIERGAEFHTFVDDRAVVADGVVLGIGVVICPGVVISADALIGDHVHINYNCAVGHDTIIGDFSTLSPTVTLMGGIRSGADVFFGGGVSVLPRLAIGNGATVGAGAVVIKSVGVDQVVAGNPAKEIASR